MLKNRIIAVLMALLLISMCWPSVSAEARYIQGNCVPEESGKYCIQVEFTNIPEDYPVEYAQIKLTCISQPHDMVAESFQWLSADSGLLVTHQIDTVSNTLLVLIEPENRLSSGIGNSSIFSFHVQQTVDQPQNPEFDLSAILVLADGTELELNETMNWFEDDPPSTTPSTVPTAPPTDPTVPPTVSPTVPSTEAPSQPSTAPETQPATAPTTVPSSLPEDSSPEHSVPPTADSNPPKPAGNSGAQVWRAILIILMILTASGIAVIAGSLYWPKLRKRK